MTEKVAGQLVPLSCPYFPRMVTWEDLSIKEFFMGEGNFL
jgi:hypothetical protein